MANELKHGSVGTELTQAAWEGVGTHVFDSQATGDIPYASSATQLSRLGISSTATHFLGITGGVPAWKAVTVAGSDLTGTSLASGIVSSSLTSVGTIATGGWQGTAIGASYVATLNQSTTGNAATATALATARTIGGTSFDGSANIAVGLADTATALATARTIGGTSFDGTANIAV